VNENQPEHSETQAAPAAPRRGALRRIGRALLFVLLASIVVGESVWLLRWPLFDWLARERVEGLLGEALQGTAKLGAIDGNVFTGLRVRGIEIEGRGLVQRVRNGNLRVRLAPLALLRGDFAGIVDLQVRVGSLQLDLTTLGQEQQHEAALATSGAPPDLGAFAAMLPSGAEIVIDELKVRGLAEHRDGAARITLAAASPRAPTRRLHALLPGIDATVALARDGELQCELAARDVATLPRLFAAVDHLQGGEATASVTLQLAPIFVAAAHVRIDGMRANGRRVERCELAARVQSDGLTSLDCDIEGPGLSLRASGGSMQFASLPTSLRGDVALAVRDLSPWAEFLPAAVRELLPIVGSLKATAGDGRITIADGALRTAGAVLRLRAGSLRIDGAPSLDAPIRAEIELLDAAQLPLPTTLPLRPTGGRATLELSQRNSTYAASVEVDLQVRDAADRDGTLRGRATATRASDGTIAFAPQLELRGQVLRGGAQRLDLRARGELTATQLRIAEATLDLDGGANLTVRGIAPLVAADTTALLTRLELDASWQALPLALFTAFAPLPPGGSAPVLGEVAGSLSGKAGAFGLQLRATADSAPFLRPQERATLALDAAIDDQGATLSQASLQTPFVRLVGTGAVPGVTMSSLLTGALDWPKLSPSLDLDVDCDEAYRARLEALAGAAFTTSLRLRGRSLQVAELRAFARGHEASATGVVRALDSGFAIDDLVLRDQHGSSIALAGTLGALDPGDWRLLLRAASLRATFDNCALEPWLSATGVTAAQARLNGAMMWQPAAPVGLTLDLRCACTGIVSGERTVDAELALAAEADAAGTHLRQLTMTSNGASAHGSGTLQRTLLQLLDDPASALDVPIEFAFVLPATDLARLPEQLLGMAQLTGKVALDVALGGTLRQPEPRSLLQIQNGSLLTGDGQRLDDVQARIVVTPAAARIETLTASRGRGPLSVQGNLTAPGPLWERWREAEVDLTVAGTDVLLHRRAGVKVRSDLDLHVHGPLREMTVDGLVTLEDSVMLQRIPLLDFQRTSGRAAVEGIAIPGLDLGSDVSARLDVGIATKEPFVIRNNILDARLDIAMAVRGTLARPVLEGTISGPEARILLPGIRLRASTLLIEFRRDAPRFPIITVNANGRRHGFDVNVVVRGRYDRPEILLSSSPPLPPEELIVLITTGARPDSLRGSAGVGTVLGAYLAQELADWIFGSESTEAKESFVDRFTIETGTELSRGGTQSIVVEFRVFDDIYLKGERDVYEDLNMGVVYRLKFR
jgi:hypothetical protein